MARRAISRSLWLAPVLAWLGLVILLGATGFLCFVPMAGLNLPVSLCIAGAKALIIGLVFMRLARGGPLEWLAAGAGPVWIFIMFVLMASDYLTR